MIRPTATRSLVLELAYFRLNNTTLMEAAGSGSLPTERPRLFMAPTYTGVR